MKISFISLITKALLTIGILLQSGYAMDVRGVDINSLKNRIKNCDTPNTLSHAEFTRLQNEKKITNEQADELIDYGYEIGNPLLYRKASESIRPESYCINLLWIHASKQPFQSGGHLMGTEEQQFKEKILNPILNWQLKQPLAQINFWFDGDMLENDASVIESTTKKLAMMGVCLDRVKLLNIRDIETVKKNPTLFAEDIPVYFRVDFAKVLTAQHIMKYYSNIDYVINCDCDIPAITCSHLFDQKTLKELKELGRIFGSNHIIKEENSFIMLSKKIAYKAHEEYMINRTLKLALKSISDIKQGSPYAKEVLEQLVFTESYPAFKTAMELIYKEKTGKQWSYKNGRGKGMIIPPSKFAADLYGYTDNQIEVLKKFLEQPATALPASHPSIPAAFFLTDGNWVNGIARNGAAFFVPNTPPFTANYKIGNSVKFIDNENRIITNILPNGSYLNVHVEGETLDPNKVGLPSQFITTDTVYDNFFLTDGNWEKGIAKHWAGFFVPNTPEFSNKYKVGKYVYFEDHSCRKITGIKENGGYLNINVSGNILNARAIGLPSHFTLV